MIETNENPENLNFAEATIGTFIISEGTLTVESENLQILETAVSDQFKLNKGQFTGPIRILYEGVNDLTTNYEKSRGIKADSRTCIGGSVYNQQMWFEAWFSYSSSSVYVFEQPDLEKNGSPLYKGVFIENN